MSTLRKFQTDPKNLINTALNMFRSKNIRTIVVEGICDKRFLSQWIPASTAVRFDGFDGKQLVNKTYAISRSSTYSQYEFLYFVSDVDFDIISKQQLHQHPMFVYNAYCFEENRLHYNDLESYLINSSAFEKVLVNLDIDVSEATSLRKKLENASKVTGSLRAADIIVQKSMNLRSSVLNGLDIEAFFNSRDISFNETELFKALPRWSNYKEYTADLIGTAEQLRQKFPTSWSLSRGHDLTEMLALHLVNRGHKGMTAEKLELMLRLACEFSSFQDSPMGKRLATSIGLKVIEQLG